MGRERSGKRPLVVGRTHAISCQFGNCRQLWANSNHLQRQPSSDLSPAPPYYTDSSSKQREPNRTEPNRTDPATNCQPPTTNLSTTNSPTAAASRPRPVSGPAGAGPGGGGGGGRGGLGLGLGRASYRRSLSLSDLLGASWAPWVGGGCDVLWIGHRAVGVRCAERRVCPGSHSVCAYCTATRVLLL